MRPSLALLALAGCTSNALGIPEVSIETGASALPAVGDGLPSGPHRSSCPGDDRIRPLSLDLSTFVPNADTTATFDGGQLTIRGGVLGRFGSDGWMGAESRSLDLPDDVVVRGVSVCYQVDDLRSPLALVRLLRRERPLVWRVEQDDDTQLDGAAYCTDALYYDEEYLSRPHCLRVDPERGEVRVSLGILVGNLADAVRVQSVTLALAPK